MNAFQSIVYQLTAMKMVIDDEMQASLLLCLLLDSWETFVITISNFVSNGALSIELVKGNLFNEEIRRKAYDMENTQAPLQGIRYMVTFIISHYKHKVLLQYSVTLSTDTIEGINWWHIWKRHQTR